MPFVHDQCHKWVCLRSPNREGGPILMLEAFTCKSQTTLRVLLVKTNKTIKGLEESNLTGLANEVAERAELLGNKACSVRVFILLDVVCSLA